MAMINPIYESLSDFDTCSPSDIRFPSLGTMPFFLDARNCYGPASLPENGERCGIQLLSSRPHKSNHLSPPSTTPSEDISRSYSTYSHELASSRTNVTNRCQGIEFQSNCLVSSELQPVAPTYLPSVEKHSEYFCEGLYAAPYTLRFAKLTLPGTVVKDPGTECARICDQPTNLPLSNNISPIVLDSNWAMQDKKFTEYNSSTPGCQATKQQPVSSSEYDIPTALRMSLPQFQRADDPIYEKIPSFTAQALASKTGKIPNVCGKDMGSYRNFRVVDQESAALESLVEGCSHDEDKYETGNIRDMFSTVTNVKPSIPMYWFTGDSRWKWTPTCGLEDSEWEEHHGIDSFSEEIMSICINIDVGATVKSSLRRSSEEESLAYSQDPSWSDLSEGSSQDLSWSDSGIESSQDQSVGDAGEGLNQDISWYDSSIGSNSDPSWSEVGAQVRLDPGYEVNPIPENLSVNVGWWLEHYLRHQGSPGPAPGSLSVSQRDRERGRRARNPRRLFSGTEEAAVAHARTVMELVDDIASTLASDDIIEGDYILQIQRRPGYHRFYNEQLFSRQIQHAVATLKQAVEKFSANTQEISASLRAFTQKLQETEFPNDVTSTEELLRSQCSEYSVLKDDLLSASRHGETLLNCIKRPGEPRSARLCPDKLINVTAVERLLVQLEETERTFDEFWTRHEGRLTQCLQLRRFETDFRELQTCLEVSLKQLSGMSEVGDSVLHVDQLLAEAQDFHMLTADQLEKAEELRIIGTQLIESQHYAVDSIQPKCVELVRMRDAFHDRITKRLETLHKCRDLQERIERANKWCTEGVELLASQQIERCQAPEFAEEALRELDEFMASSDHSRLGSSRELKTMFEDVITPETKGLVQQVLKRIEDVQMMCEKRKSSLKKLATRLPRPVHAVTPEPAVPLYYPQGQGGSSHPHSHPASPLHADLPKSPKSIRKASTLPKMLRLKPGSQSIRSRPRPATVCFGQDVDFCRPIIEASLRAQQKGVLRRRESFAHGSLRDESAIPSYSSGIYILGPQIIQNLQLLNVHMKQSSKLGDSGDSPEWTSDAEAARAKRGHVLRELLDTERIYVSELCSILKGYKDEMLNPEMQPLIPINLYGKSDLLFGNMEEIFRFHNDVFLRDLENCINTPELIGLCFVQRKDSFHRLYSLYCQNKPQSEELRRQVGDSNPFFKECQRRLHHKLPLGAYLLKPVQRITKYQLLLKDLLKCVEGSQGRRELQEAVDTMLTVLKCLNDSMHQVAIVGFPGNLADLGKLLMQGPFSVWNESKKGLRELRLKPAQRHIFLYEKVLLFTKRAGKDTDRATYHFKNALKMSQVGLTESIRGNKGDVRKFEVWLQGRQEVHIILAPSVEVKETWVKEIKRVLLDQFEYLKGENIKQYSSRIQKGASLNGIRIPPLSPTTQHRALRQTASWDMAGNGMSGSGGSISSSSSEGRQGESSKESGRRSSRMVRSVDATLGDAPEEEEESWSSDYSASDEEEDQETFSESTEYTSSRFLVLADYNAMGGSEVSLREGDYVDLIKVGCAGWWYVRVSGTPYEGWAPAAYLERVLKKGSRSSPSVSSQESSSGLKHATSRSSVASLSAKSEEVNIL